MTNPTKPTHPSDHVRSGLPTRLLPGGDTTKFVTAAGTVYTRRHADYEYWVDGHKLRVERYGRGWTYRIWWENGDYEDKHNDGGDYCRLKRDAKAEGLDTISSFCDDHLEKRPAFPVAEAPDYHLV